MDRMNLCPSKADIDHHTDTEVLHVFSYLFALIDPWMFILEKCVCVCVCCSGGCPRLTPALQTLSSICSQKYDKQLEFCKFEL